MATFTAGIRKDRINKKGECNIRILVVQKRDIAFIPTDWYVKPEFMLTSGKIDKKHPNHKYLNAEIAAKISAYELKILQLRDAADILTAKQIKEYLTAKPSDNIDFFEFADKHIAFLKASGKRTHQIYGDSINQIKAYVSKPLLPFNDITVEFLIKFENYSKLKGRSVNTISVYLRAMRTIYLKAMDELNQEGMEPVITSNPFRKFKIKSEPTRKRNLSVDIIKAIRDYEPSDYPITIDGKEARKPKNKIEIQTVARDMFMLTFYLIGINTIDLFYSKGIKDGRIDYIRSKTETKNGREYSIKVEPEALKLINKYKGEKYLLRFSDHNKFERDGETRVKHQRFKWQYADEKAFRVMINDNLKDIAKDLGITEDITTYWARHSWSTIAWNDCEIPESTISVCLGHDETSNQTTQIYIEKRLRIVDESNRKVLDVLR